jgi:hypothetical protein
MSPHLEVDTVAVRAVAADVSRLADRVSAALAEVPAPVPVPRWSTSDAAGDAADAARRSLAEAAWAVGEAAREIIAALHDYQAADERAESRLRGAV